MVGRPMMNIGTTRFGTSTSVAEAGAVRAGRVDVEVGFDDRLRNRRRIDRPESVRLIHEDDDCDLRMNVRCEAHEPRMVVAFGVVDGRGILSRAGLAGVVKAR